MMKKLGVMAACALLGTACGVPGLDAFNDDADVEIVNADATQSSDEDEPAGDDTDGSILGSASVESTAPSAGTGTADETPLEVAVGSAISLTSDDSRMTGNLNNPTQGWAELTVDRVFSSGRFGDDAPAAGNKYVVVEYQLLAIERGNLFDEAFRLEADGQSYSPLTSINEITAPGLVFNDVLVFEVPSSAIDLELQGGVLPGSVDGFTATYAIGLAPFDDADPDMASPPVIADADVEATADGIMLTADDTRMSTNPEDPTRGVSTLTVDAAYSTASIDGDGAGPAAKFIVVEYQLLGSQAGNLFQHAFRLNGGGEAYSPVGNLNEILKEGEVYNGSLLFVVPRHINDFELEGGVPVQWTDGLRTTFEFWLPTDGSGQSSGSDADSDSGAAPSTVEVEATASSVSTTDDDPRMTTNPADATGGWGTLTIDGAYSTAKIEQIGARPGNKFVVIEYQLLGGAHGNFFEEAFRLEAEGELYSPRNGINELVKPGEVFNGTLAFEVPAQAAVLELQAGVVQGSPDGYSTVYTISFG